MFANLDLNDGEVVAPGVVRTRRDADAARRQQDRSLRRPRLGEEGGGQGVARKVPYQHPAPAKEVVGGALDGERLDARLGRAAAERCGEAVDCIALR